jgi:hypothetical protein
MPYTIHSVNNLFNVNNSGTGYFYGGIVSSGDIFMRGALVATGTVLRPSDTGVLTGVFVLRSETGSYLNQFYPLNSNPAGYITTGNILTGSGIVDRVPVWTGPSGFRATPLVIYDTPGTTPILAHNSLGSVAKVRMAHVRVPSSSYGYATALTSGNNVNSDPVNGYDMIILFATGTNPANTELTLSSPGESYQHLLLHVESGALTLKNTGNMYLHSDWVAGSGQSLKLHYNFYDSRWHEEYRFPIPSGFVSGYVPTSATGSFLTTTTVGGVRTLSVTGVQTSGNVLLSGAGSVTLLLTVGTSTVTISGFTGYYPYSSNPSGYLTSADLSSYVTQSQTGAYNSIFYSVRGGQVSGAISGWNVTSNKYGVGAGIYTFYKGITGSGVSSVFAIYNRYGAVALQSMIVGTSSGMSTMKSHTVLCQSGSGVVPMIMLNADVGPFGSQDFQVNYFSTGTTGLALNITNLGSVSGDYLVTVLLGGSFHPMNILEL